MATTDNADLDGCSVVVSSFDGNDDLWLPFFTLFFRYWPDCPYPVYLVSNRKTFADDRVISICVGEDKGWATNMKRALEQIPTPYVISMLDDLFLERLTNTGYVASLIEYAQKRPIAYIGLIPFTDYEEGYSDYELGLRKVSAYACRVSFRASLWDKKIFYGLIIDGENFWDMEKGLSVRSHNVDAMFLGVTKPAFHYQARSAVIRGRWMYDAIRLCKKEGIGINLKRRRIDYEWKWRQACDTFRKNAFVRKVACLPGVRKLLSWFFWRVFSLKINKL